VVDSRCRLSYNNLQRPLNKTFFENYRLLKGVSGVALLKYELNQMYYKKQHVLRISQQSYSLQHDKLSSSSNPPGLLKIFLHYPLTIHLNKLNHTPLSSNPLYIILSLELKHTSLHTPSVSKP